MADYCDNCQFKEQCIEWKITPTGDSMYECEHYDAFMDGESLADDYNDFDET